MAIKVVFITTTGAGTFTIPADFGSLVSVEAIGAGQGSSGAPTNQGGNGGNYAKSTAITGLYPGKTTYYAVGASTSSHSPVETWFNANANTVPSANTAGIWPGGSIGTVVRTGGTAGNWGGSGSYSGGGGAAGPGGNGGNSGNGFGPGYATGSGGGGGAGLTGGGGSGGDSKTTAQGGGAGGNGGAPGSSGGGTGGLQGFGTSTGSPGTPGTGGGGGGGAQSAGGGGGGGGASGQIVWTQTSDGATAGPGGGGGGAINSGTPGGNGGLYGGGAGSGPAKTALGGQGIIVFTYIPFVPTLVTRLTNTGTLLVNGTFDEITKSIHSINSNTVFASTFDEVTISGGAVQQRITNTGTLQIAGEFNEVTGII